MKPVSGGCPAHKASCLCVHVDGHEGPHLCNCKGSWNEDGSIVTFPLGSTDPFEALAAFMGWEDDDE
jgi:hypothetical protein